MEIDFDNLKGEQKNQWTVIEDRLRGASGMMPSMPSMKRRLTFLERNRDVVEKHERPEKLAERIAEAIAVLALVTILSGKYIFKIDVFELSATNWIVGSLIVGAIVFSIYRYWPKITNWRRPASSDELNVEIAILKHFIEQKS